LTYPSAGWRKEMGIDASRILHGEQSFTYHRLAHAGEKLLFESRIADIYDKKGGALSFVVRETRVSNAKGEHVADLRSVLVHRNG
jgi:acyl dehydratase